MISLIENEASLKRKWIDRKEMIDIIAIAESTPGPIAVNSATFIGYKTAGIFGSISATLGVVLPSFIIVSLISIFYEAFKSITFINSAFMGIRVCVVILMLNTLIKLSKQTKKDIFSIAVVLTSFVIAAFTDIDVVFVLLMAGALSLFIPSKKGEENGL